MPRVSSLKFRLLLLILLAIIPGLVLTLSTTAEQRQMTSIETQENILKLARQTADAQTSLIKDARYRLARLAQLPAVRSGNPTACEVLFPGFLKQYPNYTELGVSTPDGDVFCNAMTLTQPLNFTDRVWVRRAVEIRDFVVGNYQIDPITGKAVIPFGYPVLNAKGQVQAVVFAKVEVDRLNQTSAAEHLPQGSTIKVFDRNGVILAHYPDPQEWVGKSARESPLFQALLTYKEGIAKAPGLVDSTMRLYAFSWLAIAPQNADLYVTVGIPEDVIFAEVDRLMARNLTLLGLVTGLALAAAWFGADLLILRPVKTLVKATKQLATGDLSTRIRLPQTQGELSQLAFAFDQMAEALEQRELQLEHQAFYDPLTNLPNRTLFMDRLGSAFRRAERHEDYLFAVLFLDLDRFKVVNDSLGHTAGDQLLIEIARRLESCLRPEDTVARLGGDEFTILLENIQNISGVIKVVERIQAQLTQPFNLGVLGTGSQAVAITASIGITLGGGGRPGGSQDTEAKPDAVLRNADIAMYRAKKHGTSYEIFDTAMHTRIVARWQLETFLRQALEHQEFEVYYQPIIFLATGQITGFEALVRWNHPDRGLISPMEFIPLAEETGLIIPISRWLLQEVCDQMWTWQGQFPPDPASPGAQPLTISVNLSGRQFSQPDLIEQIQQILQVSGLQASSLRLEITESLIAENAGLVQEKLLQLRNSGLQLHIDDFGTGYSSLSRLQSFPINALKIDRAFVNQMHAGGGDARIIQTIVTLAHNLELEVVAEGVETMAEAAQLQQIGCDYAQGYFFSRPVNSQAAEALLASLS